MESEIPDGEFCRNGLFPARIDRPAAGCQRRITELPGAVQPGLSSDKAVRKSGANRYLSTAENRQADLLSGCACANRYTAHIVEDRPSH